VPAARDLLAGSLIPYSTPSNAHPPLVLAWLALSWKMLGQSALVTRCAMLLLAAFSLLGFFRLARTAANTSVAVASTLLTAVYPVFFAQSSLAHVDLPAAGLIFWGLESYIGRRRIFATLWFSLAALAKETAIFVPLALGLWEIFCALLQKGDPGSTAKHTSAAEASSQERSTIGTSGTRALPGLSNAVFSSGILLVTPAIPLALWYTFHYLRTGYVFGNPEFFRYNVQATLHPLRIFLALLLRTWQAFGYFGLYLLTISCLLAMRLAPIEESDGQPHPRIDVNIQTQFLAITTLYVVILSVIGGAVLARYMLPVVPLAIMVCVSTIWRRVRPWKTAVAIIALTFALGLFINPPYAFAPEDNLAYRDYILLHQRAESLLQARFPNARVLTAWPASDELTQPYLGYVPRPMQVLQIEDFTAEQLLSTADVHSDARARFDVALVFSTKYQPPPNIFDRWQLWQEWKARYFGFHRDLTPEAAASVLGGNLVYVEYQRGQWVGIVEIVKIEEAGLRTSAVSDHR
jgi:Dolichyl-phosphate-mannose-protein mannosyltransferase